MEDSMGKSLLAPGFRFHPTDEELVRYYLKRKVSKLPLRFDAIHQIDVYKFEPWDLPDKSKLKSRDLEWYFFSVLDKKYGNGSKTNRATQNGYWKTTGKDKPVYHKSTIVGMKKTLVFHSGRAPKGARSNWVMHEYRLVDLELDKAGIAQDAYVLCRIFQKSGTGPKNGEQYGAPFVEEEWDEEVVMVPAQPEEATGDAEVNQHDDYAQPDDLHQDLYLSMPSENGPLLLDFYYGESSNYVDDSVDFTEDDTKPFIGTTGDSCGPEMPDDQKHFDLPEFNDVEPKLELDDYFTESIFNVNPEESKLEMEDCFTETNCAVEPAETDFLLSELQFDTTTSPPYDNALFLETNDLLGHVEADPSSFEMLDEYLAFFDADTESTHNVPFESSKMISTESLASVQAFREEKHVNGGGTEQPPMNASEGVESSSSSDKKYESTKWDSDMQFPFSKEASRMLGKIHAPPAFASEYPTAKNASPLRFTSVGQASSSVHVRAGMIQISNMNLSYGKNGTVDLILSFAIPESDANFDDTYTSSRLLPGKNMSTAVSSVFLYLVCFWVLLLSMSYKIGTFVYAR